MKAKYAGDCDRCDEPIKRGADIVIKTVLGMPVMLHPWCASGQDDGDRPVKPKKTTQTKMFVSGFCNPNNPPDSHARCKVAAGELLCTCECHTPMIVAGEESEAPNRVGSPKVEPTTPDGHAASPAPGPRPPVTFAEQVTSERLDKIVPNPLEHHGFYDDLPEGEYHKHPTSLSQSGAKLILKAPALFQWDRTHPRHKDIWDFGSAAHALVLGRGMESIYVAPYDDWIKRKGPVGGVQYTTDEKRLAREMGLSPILPKDWLIVCDMAEELSKNTLVMEQLLHEGRPEVSAFAPDERTGVLRRARFDWLGSTILSDYKTADCADPHVWVRKNAAAYGYHQQHAWYLDMARDLGHPADAFAFIVQEKDAPYLVSVVELDAAAVARGRELNDRALEIFRDCEASGIWPGYQQPGTFTTVSLPTYSFYDNEDAA